MFFHCDQQDSLWCFIWGKPSGVKAGLKLSIQRMKIMASRLTTSWQIDGKTMETVTGFIFLGSKITADGDCSHEIKRCLLHWKKSYDQPRQHIKKQGHYFANRSPSVKAMVFPVIMYGCNSWTIKKAENQRIDAFELWCWRRLLRVLGLQEDPIRSPDIFHQF